MPIKVTCTCGAAFAAKDELAGKTVACPKCQQPLTIGGGAAPAQRPAVAARPAAAPQPAADLSAPSIFDEAGLKARQITGQVCPSCFRAMKQGAILCVHCGYNMQLGRKLVAQVHGRGDAGHGESAEIALQRAARTLEEDKIEERKKTSEGIPWWGYLILFLGAVGLLTMMMLLDSRVATVIALGVLFGGGTLMTAYAAIMVYVIAFRDSVVQGLCVLFIPFYFFIYIIMKWDECGSLFLIWLGGGFIQGLSVGVYVGIMTFGGDDGAIHLRPQPRIAMVHSAVEVAVNPPCVLRRALPTSTI